MSEMMKIHVTVPGRTIPVAVDACKVEVTDDDILMLYDAEGGIRARFRRWEFYVRVEAA